jgi:hypothetical protein
MPHPDFDALLDAVIPFAQQMLTKHGEFYPIGATMAPDGTVALAAAHPESEHPASQEVIDLLLDGFRQQAAQREIRATVVCYDGRVTPPNQTEKVDAICARLEHESGEAIAVAMPYQTGMLGRLNYGELLAVELIPEVFVTTKE